MADPARADARRRLSRALAQWPAPRLVALDLDGTLFAHDGALSPATVQAVTAIRSQGVAVALATGRMVDSALPYWRSLGLGSGYLVAYNGCQVVRLPDREVVLSRTLEMATARRIVQAGLAAGLLTQVYVGRELWISRSDGLAERYIARHHIAGWVRPGDEILKWPEPPVKLLFQDRPEVLQAFRRRLQDMGLAGVRIVFSQADYLECIPAGVGKGAALAVVAERLGVPREAVLAMGDQENDIDMLRWAGIGVAMGQAAPPVRAAARLVTLTVEEEGAAVLLEALAERLKAAAEPEALAVRPGPEGVPPG